jgi:predicted DNA-binding protein (UPF0251 family)
MERREDRAMNTAEKLEQVRHELERVRLETALRLQRKGLTFTEIARQMRVDRQAIVNALYWERV